MCSGAVQNVTTDGTVETISGLTQDAAVYIFRVAAIWTNGMTGPFSNPVNISSAGKCYVGRSLYLQVCSNDMIQDCLDYRYNTHVS